MTGRNDSLCEDRDFAGGGRGGCVQIILCPSHLMPIDKLWCDVNGVVAPSGQWARLTKSAKHLLDDGCDVPGIVDSSVIGTQPNQAQRLYCLLK